MKRVLVIEDDPDMAELLGHMIQMNGHEPAVFIAADEALADARANPPDAILIDIMMEQMDGWTMCEWLRQITDAPVAFISAWRTGENAERAKTMGARFITKPLSHYDLGRELNLMLG
ncbi:MAG: response regulator [Chloroflexi bacterium]|nr:response regulator [Chloroflexota bacterium]MBI3762299.1 response regulator [Chloroflexota bacterium]